MHQYFGIVLQYYNELLRVYFDISKAFETVGHPKLMYKL